MATRDIFVVSHHGMEELEKPKIFLKKRDAESYITHELAKLTIEAAQDRLDKDSIDEQNDIEICRWAENNNLIEGESFVYWTDRIEYRMDKIPLNLPDMVYDGDEIKIIA